MKTWKGEGWEVRYGKWQDSPPDVVDHVISDPPYDERTHKGALHGGFESQVIGGLSFEPFEWAHAKRWTSIALRWVVSFNTTESVGSAVQVFGDEYVRAGWWLKPDGAPQMSGDRPAVPGDAIVIAHRKGRKRWNGRGKHAVWRVGVERKDRCHETQKPIALMRQLIEDFTDPGDLVWDPYGGSMTTGVACLQLGRRFLGHEMQLRYAEVGAERLKAAQQGLTLKDARAGQLPLFGG